MGVQAKASPGKIKTKKQTQKSAEGLSPSEKHCSLWWNQNGTFWLNSQRHVWSKPCGWVPARGWQRHTAGVFFCRWGQRKRVRVERGKQERMEDRGTWFKLHCRLRNLFVCQHRMMWKCCDSKPAQQPYSSKLKPPSMFTHMWNKFTHTHTQTQTNECQKSSTKRYCPVDE